MKAVQPPIAVSATSAPTTQADTFDPRHHPCEVCGTAWGAFAVERTNGRPGRWFCLEHLPEAEKRRGTSVDDLKAAESFYEGGDELL